MRSNLIDKRIGGIRLVGYSLAGEETVIVAPELNVCFDIGRAPIETIPVDFVCLSHGHMDHAAGIAYYFSQRTFVGNRPGTVLAHTSLVSPIKRILSGWSEVEGHPTPANIVGTNPGDEFSIRRDLLIKAFKVNHSAGALGFAVIESRHKLRPAFADHTGPQLVELKRKGVKIEYESRIPLVAYMGDTALGDWLDQDEVRNSQVAVMECTFFDAEHLHRARQGRHIHVRDLPEAMERLDSRNVVLIHTTRRTSIPAAKRAIREQLTDEQLSRIHLLMERPRRSSGVRRQEPAERKKNGVSPE